MKKFNSIVLYSSVIRSKNNVVAGCCWAWSQPNDYELKNLSRLLFQLVLIVTLIKHPKLFVATSFLHQVFNSLHSFTHPDAKTKLLIQRFVWTRIRRDCHKIFQTTTFCEFRYCLTVTDRYIHAAAPEKDVTANTILLKASSKWFLMNAELLLYRFLLVVQHLRITHTQVNLCSGLNRRVADNRPLIFLKMVEMLIVYK